MNEKTARIGKDSDGLVSARVHGHYTMPAPDSQNAEILTILQSGRLLTSYEMHMMGIQGAATRVMELRRMGYPILCVMESHINKRGKAVQRGRYHLATAQEGEA